MVVQWLALLPPGFETQLVYSPLACLDFLWVLWFPPPSFLRSVSLSKALAEIWTRSLGSRWLLTASLECRAAVSLCCTSSGVVSDTTKVVLLL